MTIQDENYEQDFKAAMDALAAYEKGIRDYNQNLLEENKIDPEDYESLIEYCDVVGKIEIVSKPKGANQNEESGMFTAIWVDQTTVGESGDSYAGHIYGKIGENKWLKIPYEC